MKNCLQKIASQLDLINNKDQIDTIVVGCDKNQKDNHQDHNKQNILTIDIREEAHADIRHFDFVDIKSWEVLNKKLGHKVKDVTDCTQEFYRILDWDLKHHYKLSDQTCGGFTFENENNLKGLLVTVKELAEILDKTSKYLYENIIEDNGTISFTGADENSLSLNHQQWEEYLHQGLLGCADNHENDSY